MFFSKILAGKLSKLTVLAICWKIDTYRGRFIIPCSVGGKPNTNTHTAELFQISMVSVVHQNWPTLPLNL